MHSVLAQNVLKAKHLFNDNSTTILAAMGVTGTVTTAVLTGRASFKAAEIIAREETLLNAAEPMDTNGPSNLVLTKSAKFKRVWPLYIPPVVSGGLTITSIIVGNRISSHKIAALAVSSAISERALQEYKDKVVEKLTERQSTALREDIAQDRVTNNPPQPGQVIITGKGDVLCMDSLTGRYFMASVEQIRGAENRINRELVTFMSCSLSEFYNELGLPPTSYTDTVGWNANALVEVKLSTAMTPDNRPCVVIDFSTMPFTNYDRLSD
jgi:hypothetical protein